MKARGYLVEVEYDGEVLTAQGTNKAGHLALRGADGVTDPEDYANPLRIPRAEIVDVSFRDANPIVNGRITVKTTAGRTYKLNFRRKQRDPFRELATLLGAL